MYITYATHYMLSIFAEMLPAIITHVELFVAEQFLKSQPTNFIRLHKVYSSFSNYLFLR